MENGAPLTDVAALRHFYDRGIRYVTLTHGKDNQICDSSYDQERTWKGLSPFGRELVREMNRIGMMIDVSHVSDDAFFQVLEVTEAPVIASHSSCRHFTPGWERNMDDDMIRALAENGGVIQINFGSAFLTAAAQEQSAEYWNARSEYLEENGYDDDGPEAEAFRDSYWEGRTKLYATVADVADHIDHVRDLVGVEHVGFGSDFDGVGDSLPVGLKSVADYPVLLTELLQRGYSEEEIELMCSGNVLRVWSRVEELAGLN
jgi:membrane dipeptidase